MPSRAPVLVGAVLLGACLTVPAQAATPRVETHVYLGSGGAAAGPISAYVSSADAAGAGNVGQVRALSRKGEKGVRIEVRDGSGAPVAARIESHLNGRIAVLVTCDASKLALRLRGVTEVRVTPLAGACAPASGAPVLSAPTTGEVVFSFRS